VASRAKLLGALFAAAFSFTTQADSVACHITYGGETRHLEARPTTTPYTVAPTPIGSHFLFRIVFRQEPAEHASIKLYTYTNRDTSPAIIHQASYPYPVRNTAPQGDFLRREASPLTGQGTDNGFTGLNLVYETMHDSELQYWCELKADTAK